MAWNKGEEAPKKEKVVPRTKSAKSKARLEGQRTNDQGSTDNPHGAVAGKDDCDDDEDTYEDEWEDEPDEEELAREALVLQYETIQYWAVRMSPFYKQTREPFLETHVAIANRIGTESGR